MSQKSTLACEVPGCPATYTHDEARMSLKKLREAAAEAAGWGILTAPKGIKIELCPGCLGEIMKPEVPKNLPGEG